MLKFQNYGTMINKVTWGSNNNKNEGVIAMSKVLFKGDISAPLSSEEIKEFMGHFNVDVDLSRKDRQHYAAKLGLPANCSEKDLAQAFLSKCINEANGTVTGRMQMRKLMRNKDERFNVTFGADTGVDGAGGIYFSRNDQICLPKSLLDKKFFTNTLLHECTHDYQNPNPDKFLYTLADLETQAFSSQLANELHDERKSARYETFYKECQKKWLRIARHPKKTPAGLPNFEPVPGLTAKEMAEAQKRYADQMASLETQSAIMLDFIGDKKSPIPKQRLSERVNEVIDIIQDPSKTPEEKEAARLELIALYGGGASGSKDHYFDQDLKGGILPPMGGRIDENIVKRMKAENPFVTDGHFDKIREIEAIHIKNEENWQRVNQTLDFLKPITHTNPQEETPVNNTELAPTNTSSTGSSALAHANKTLGGAGQDITQETTDDTLALNIQNSSQRTG